MRTFWVGYVLDVSCPKCSHLYFSDISRPKKNPPIEGGFFMARPAGIEPAVLVLETSGLPLTDGPKKISENIFYLPREIF